MPMCVSMAQDCQKTDESKGPGKQNKNILSYILVC